MYVLLQLTCLLRFKGARTEKQNGKGYYKSSDVFRGFLGIPLPENQVVLERL